MSCDLTTTSEKAALSSAESHRSLAMASILAPVGEAVERLPLELSAVVDRSGSMSGQKMELMKRTLEMLCTRAGLRDSDRLSIVSFDNAVREELPLTAMTKAGRAQAEAAVRGLSVGGSTNLSGGLLRGVDALASAAKPSGACTRAVLLFTDGQANHGIQDTPGIVAAAQGAMAAAPMTIFTFGFGADHNEDMLRAVADASNGLYYYIQRTDDIPSAFADCLGGLVSVVAQNAVLALQTDAAAARVEKVLGSYKVTSPPADEWMDVDGDGDAKPRLVRQDASPMLVELGDLYAEDEKDILLELSLPALPEPRAAPHATLRATLRYFSVASSRMEEVSSELSLSRPAETPAGQPINLKLDEQRNRMQVAEAMAAAAQLADGGNLAQGREMLMQVMESVQRSESASTPMSNALLGDCKRLTTEYANEVQYRSVGSKMSKMSAMCHQQQRSNHVSAEVYSKGSKGAMKRKFF